MGPGHRPHFHMCTTCISPLVGRNWEPAGRTYGIGLEWTTDRKEGFPLARDKDLRTVQQVEKITDPARRQAIRQTVSALGEAEIRSEPHCEYSIVLSRDSQRLVLKQYRSGKLLIQGTAHDLFTDVMSTIHPGRSHAPPRDERAPESSPEIALPYIGIDESGKGDYFGPLVIAAVLIDEASLTALTGLGVRDSKTLKIDACRELAAAIRRLLPERFEEVEIAPPRYNDLYAKMKTEGKNLNDLLAWGHARSLENILVRHRCTTAVSDQFGNKKYLQSRLQARGREITLIQTPRAERHMAVAAASILARDRFLRRLDQMGQQHGFCFPRGASPTVTEAARKFVARNGLDALHAVAKLHFRTTGVVTNR